MHALLWVKSEYEDTWSMPQRMLAIHVKRALIYTVSYPRYGECLSQCLTLSLSFLHKRLEQTIKTINCTGQKRGNEWKLGAGCNDCSGGIFPIHGSAQRGFHREEWDSSVQGRHALSQEGKEIESVCLTQGRFNNYLLGAIRGEELSDNRWLLIITEKA